jgi:hypothetical protein
MKKECNFWYFIIGISILSLIETILIITRIINPIANYSIANLFFEFLSLLIIILCGIIFYKEKLINSIIKGGILGLSSAIVPILFSIYFKLTNIKIPIFGLKINADPAYLYWSLLLVILIENVILGIIILIISKYITKKIKIKKKIKNKFF